MNIESLVNRHIKTFIFAKDLHHRIIYCNEAFAEVAGEDSPFACQGKTDNQLIWEAHAHLYMASDIPVYKGQSLFNMIEPQQQVHKLASIMVNKHPLFNEKDELIGVAGSYIDVTDLGIPNMGRTSDFVHEFNQLTAREQQILRYALLGQTARSTAQALNLSPKTVESHMASIKRKLQCETRGDLIMQAVKSGLYHHL